MKNIKNYATMTFLNREMGFVTAAKKGEVVLVVVRNTTRNREQALGA